MRKKVLRGRWLAVPVLILATACAGEGREREVVVDLVAGFGLADTWSETRSIDFGTLRARRHLVSGWSVDAWDRQRSRSFVRGVGAESVLRFEVIEPRELMLRFLAGRTDTTSERPLRVELSINDYPIEILEIEPHTRRIRCQVPSGVLRVGGNEMSLRYLGTEDAPELRPVWYELDLRFQGSTEPPLPAVASRGDALIIPFGTKVEYTLELPPDARLVIEQLRFVGSPGGRLRMVLERDQLPASELEVVTESRDRIEVALPSSGPRVVRLTLRADHPSPDLVGRSGVRATAAAITAVTTQVAERRDPVADPKPRAGSPPNVLLYVVDTLRADHLGLYGYDKPVSPRLDRFAAGATVFDNAVAQSSWTRASMASIFTGLWPVKHAANGRKDTLDPEARTLAEILAAAGYQTEALVRNWNVFPVFGFRQGFEEFRRIREGKADRVNRFVAEFLSSRDQSRPFFLWVHTVDPHEPYRPPAATREMFLEQGQPRFDLEKHPPFKATHEMSASQREEIARYLLALYDAEVRFNDQGFGELVDLLEEGGLLDSTLVVFASDHGEEFLDHGTWGHGRNLYAENLNVPLIIRFPDRGQGRRVAEVVQHIDLMPTILDYVGVPLPDAIEGRSLLPLVADGADTVEFESRPVFSFLHLDGAPNRSLVEGRWKLVQRLGADGAANWTALFDRRADPEERRDQSARYPIRVRYMELILEAKTREGSLLTTEEAILDAETEKALKALGYLQ